MSNSEDMMHTSNIDFNQLRKLIDELTILKDIKDCDALHADYSFDWQEDANEMIKDINYYVKQALTATENKDFRTVSFYLMYLIIQFQSLNNTLNGIHEDLELMYQDDESYKWPSLNDDYIPPEPYNFKPPYRANSSEIPSAY